MAKDMVTPESGGAPAPPAGWLARAAGDWGVAPARIVGLWLVPVLVELGAVLAALAGKAAYKWYTGEDGFTETLQVLAYALALALTLALLPRLRRAGVASGLIVLYGGLALALVFMVGEEVSWGQRIVGFGTPALLAEANKQTEANLHNVYGVGATFKWLQMLAAGYGAILPLLVVGWPRLAPHRQRLAWLVPHWALVPYFAPLFLWRLYRNLFEAPGQAYFVVAEFNEVQELLFALGILLFVVYQWRRVGRGLA